MLKYNATQWFIKAFDSVYTDTIGHAHDSLALSDILFESISCNNIQAFQHILKHTNGIVPFNVQPNNVDKLLDLLNHGNVDMLKALLLMNAHRSLPTDSSQLARAIDSGNVGFVRLMLQHHCFERHQVEHLLDGGEEEDEDDEEEDPNTFSRHGVSVEMLKMLHEEFDRLYSDTDLLKMLLEHSIRCNIPESVQYIIENIPPKANTFALKKSCAGYIKYLGKHGNVNIFNTLCSKSWMVSELLKPNRLSTLIVDAANNGHVDFIRCIYNSGHKPIDANNKTLIHSFFDDVPGTLTKFRVTPLVSIRNNDLELANRLITQVRDIDVELWMNMSESMIALITNQRAPPLRFFRSSITHMLDAFKSEQSNITEEHIHKFIDNTQFVEAENEYNGGTREKYTALTVAASISPSIMRHIQQSFKLEQFSQSVLLSALDSKNMDTLAIILEQTPVSHIDWVGWRTITLAPLTFVKMVLENTPSLREYYRVIDWAFKNSLEVFHYVIELLPSKNQYFVDNMISLINQAYTRNMPSTLPTLYQRCRDNSIPIPKVPLGTLQTCSIQNCYKSLEYYFESTEFNSMTNSIKLSTLYNINHLAYIYGNIHIIRLCNSKIKHIRSKMHIVHVDDAVVDRVIQTHPRMETAIHRVFSDKKICLLIMEHVGHVHNSLQIGDRHRIKGGKLLSSKSLLKYIKYGATEWFIKAYSKVPYPPNSELLISSFRWPNLTIIDTLLNSGSVFIDHYPLQLIDIMEALSSCAIPGWERILDQYLSLVNHQTSPVYEMTSDDLQEFIHPSFIRRLLTLGFVLPRVNAGNFNQQSIVDAWLTKPWALEMFILLREQSLIDQAVEKYLAIAAIKNNVPSIFKYYMDQCIHSAPSSILVADDDDDYEYDDDATDDEEMEEEGGLNVTLSREIEYELIENCLQPKRASEIKDLVLQYIPLIIIEDQGQLIELFKLASRIGDMDLVVKLYGMIDHKKSGFSVYDGLAQALLGDTINVVNFILSNATNVSTRYTVNDISASLLSIGLIERLMAHRPQVVCDLSLVLTQAITVGNKVVIKYMMDNEHGVFKNDYHIAFARAIKVGDMDSARWIMELSDLDIDHYISMIRPGLNNQIVKIDSQLTEDDIIECASVLYSDTEDHSDLYTLLISAAKRSHSLLATVIDEFFSELRLLKMSNKQYMSPMEECIKRGDTQSIDYLVRICTEYGRHLPHEILPVEMTDPAMMEYILDKGYIKVSNKTNNYLELVVDWALCWKLPRIITIK
ncbi:hypothetical protein SAMD00019534_023010 [Acytostelium subglobosum LB1]|uniref:hypothetical protein n=1 Tax=Acytostelium subglobosum LB1 TaxID=1410327 RepID=UPI000644F065|nr:hypothetical protein SAMD00019534_023010 [Acytostelium subglobosum LB1]GAM19126.1 hypothetical protein SAMD00019534_023010 [Acytostelium subglobosum LB1]|eukprot:XP_012757053.1 hypothetical protein SAMD00019534_023010 [Acytostelium subglobosum LB1]